MTTIAKAKGGADFVPVAAGAHVAICVQVIDLGIQPGGKFNPSRKIYLKWEIPAERVKWVKDGKEHEGPAVIGRTFTLSLSEKSNLRPLLESIRGKAFTPQELDGFDIKNVLGSACMIQVTHETMQDGKVFAKVATAMSLPRGTPKPTAEGELLYYDTDMHDLAVFNRLSPWLQTRINERLVELPPAAIAEPPPDNYDDVPF